MPINLMSFDIAAQIASRPQGAGSTGNRANSKAIGQTNGATFPGDVASDRQTPADNAPRRTEAGKGVDGANKSNSAARIQETKDGQPPKNDPFVAVIKQAVKQLEKALQPEQSQAEGQPDAETVEQAQTALALLAQFANLMPGAVQAVGPDNQQTKDLIASISGGSTGSLDAGTLQELLQTGDVKLQLPTSELRSQLAGMDADMKAQMQALIAQMQAVAQALEATPEDTVPTSVARQASDEAAEPEGPKADQAQASAETKTPTPHKEAPALQAGTHPAPQAFTPPPVQQGHQEPAPKEIGKANAAANVAAKANSKGAALEMLLKPMRGEVHVEKGGEFALKGPRLMDVAYTEPVTDPRMLQSLDEQGKGLALSLHGTDLADAMGIKLPDEAAPPSETTAAPVALGEAGDVATLLDSAVSAVEAGSEASDQSANDSQTALKAEAPRAEGIHGSLLTSASPLTPGSGLEQVSGSPRAQQAVMQQVIDKVKELTPGPASIRMVLQPESLGQLTIRLTSHQGQVSVRVLTENADVQKLLDGNLSHLKAALAESGVKLDSLQVVHLPPQSQQHWSEQGHKQQQHQPQGQEHRHTRPDATDEELAELERLQALTEQLNA